MHSLNETKNELIWLSEHNEEARELFTEVILTNCYGLSHEICANRDFIDIGANMGMFSIFASYLGARKVIAVEPVSSTISLLRNNIQRSGFNNIMSLQYLASSVDGDLKEIALQDKSGHNSLYTTGEKTESIETITLSKILELLDSNHIFLKIDCEGGEYDVLLNADPKDMARIDAIAIEIHAELHPEYKGFWHIHKALYSFGFKPIRQNQLKAWNLDQFGIAINVRDLPVYEEIWIRNE